MKLFINIILVGLFVYSSACLKDKKENTMNKNIREPVVAGKFYPGEKEELKTTLKKLFLKATAKTPKGKIVALVSPHAGYAYSGWTAAKVYKQLEGKHFDTVILVGPSHHTFFKASSVYNKGEWKTPLGIVPINQDIAEQLITADKTIDFYPQAHTYEHSLEVQIPFLQTILDSFKIVPVIIGDQNPEFCVKLANAIVSVCKNKNILLVASSDLYHGSSYSDCYASDSLVLETVENFDIKGFKELYTSKEETTPVACGAGPIYTVLLASRALGANKVTLLEHTTSGDVTGEKTGYIVGYAGFVISSETKNKPDKSTDVEILNDDEKSFLLNIARRSIEQAVKHKKPPQLKSPTKRLQEPKGVFVTLTKNGMLRGCIGYIQAIKPLYQAVSDMAKSAALDDPRFSSVKTEELKQLSIEISVLTPLERIYDTEKIEVGRDGLFIKKGMYSGLLLPQVAIEYKWDRTTFLQETCHKAGLPSNAYKDPDTEIYVFQALIFNEEENGS